MERTRKTLDIQVGNMVEVLTEDNRLELLARVVNYTGDIISIQDAQGRELPSVLYNRDVKLRISQNGVSGIILGKICGSTKNFWKIDRLQKTTVAEKREYFRQAARLKARVKCLKRSAQAPRLSRGVDFTSCSVLDISAGGILIRSSEPFQPGDYLLISDLRIGEEQPFRLTCYVQRVENKLGRDAQFGCQFEPLDQREEDRLLRAIFSIQRQEIQKSRGQ